MSILIPTVLESDLPLGASFGGGTTFTASGTVVQSGRAVFHGSTVFTALPFGLVTFAGLSTFAAAGRIGSEANVFGAATFEGQGGFDAVPTGAIQSSAQFQGVSTFEAIGTTESSADFGFTFFVDILDTAVVALASGTAKRYTGRLLANGVDVPITTFRLSEPKDRIGMALSVTLARPDTSQVSLAASLQFDLGIWIAGAWKWITLLATGRMAGREHAIGFSQYRPTDTVQISTIDPLGDRMTLAPRFPVLLYDPDRMEAPEQATSESYIYKESDGSAIVPASFPVSGLSLRYILNYAYRDGCGFSTVLTNLPDVPVVSAQFTLDGGFDGGVRPLVSLFDPLYFGVETNALWIYDTNAAVPAGFAPLTLPLSAVVTLNDSIPPREIFNAMIVSFQADDDGEYWTERLETETVPNGTFGSPEYTETDNERRIREYRYLSDTTKVIRTQVVSYKTKIVNTDFQTIHEETQTDNFDSLNRKIGHKRTIRARLPDVDNDGLLTLQTVLDEVCTVSYKVNPFRPTETLQDICTIITSGKVLYDNDNTYLDKPFKIPLLDAHRNGMIDLDADIEVHNEAIKTTTERLRIRDQEQLDVQVIVIDHLAGTTERSSSTPRTGSNSLNQKRARSRQVLIEVEGTEGLGRRVPTLNAGDLPGTVVLPLARKRLANYNDPPRTATATLPDVNLGIRKGTVLKPNARSGVLGTYITVGREIVGERLGMDDQRIYQTLELKELK